MKPGVLLFAVFASAAAFQLPGPSSSPRAVGGAFHSSSPARNIRVLAKVTGDFDDREEAEYSGDIDWDAEWKKVVAEKEKGVERPGKDFYKSDAERATIKSVNKVAEGVVKARDSLPQFETPNVRSLQGDWKFWIGILVVISVGTSLLSAAGQSTSFANDPSSYYI
eukprot:CAMPEP_0183294236 /NCGR_PEP_ID=MMETSP0160_2-20130417/2651_1 /TAXON_ID=2839 ORGANISM="Odontella Sinensis, Strain Grunow 1884" /NCGR_SAMPLE_ID=MMETSP0160_2 /ASSEMBLY_ACC=CAM_ASM_000250 /LENGTH=165 /DNA_ID=CAMNT_0025455517 /DNA_START=192 /DNA_END=689 /DNA_ORIENTATION=-